ncbi:MAG TPA: PH domain-containing protein [Luteimonas sp.]|nr:PH domain-containing protein [Luteimonas sp.]
MTPTESTPAVADIAPVPERRLHPLSWLFVLIQQLRQFIVPLLALFLFKQGDRNELWPLLGVGVLALVSAWRYFTYRYHIGDDSLVIRSGVFERSQRVIPFARIHNVAVHQSLLHRLFGVAEVRLESAGGQKPEAQMRVLALADALALEALVRRGAGGAMDAVDAPTDAGTTLLQLPPMEVLRLGLVSNRGLLVLGGAFAAASQVSPRLLPNLFERWGETLFGWAGQHHFGLAQYALAAASFVLVFVLLLRLFSMALALLQYYGFRLDQHGQRLTVERGLLTRLRTSASTRRIQAWTLRESLLHRLLKRRSLGIDTAVAEQHDQQQRSLRELAPIATPQRCDELVRHLVPRASWPPASWQPLHPRAWRRLCLPGVVLPAVAALALGWRLGGWGLLALLWLPWAMFSARQQARRAGYALDATLVAVCAGWWSRHWRFAELDKLQALQLTQSPFDRRHGMATLWLDTAGAGALSPPLRIRYLAEADARALFDRLGAEIARRRLRW